MTQHEGPFLTDFDFLNVVLSREQVESEDYSETLPILQKLTSSPEGAIRFCELIDLAVHGYDADPRGLSEIPEVRRYIQGLDADFPYWLYFLSKRRSSLMAILSCMVPVSRTPDGRLIPDHEGLGLYLMRRGFPAMNQVCSFVNCSEQEIERMTNRVLSYLQDGLTDH
jgi:hypothetical protein